MRQIITPCIKHLFISLLALLFWSTPEALGQGTLTLRAPLNIYSEVDSLEPTLTLPTGTRVRMVQRLNAQWVEISWEGQARKPALVQVADLKKMLAVQRARTLKGHGRESSPLQRPVSSRWGAGAGYQLGYQYQLPQTLSTPPLDGSISGFSGAGGGPAFYIDIPFARWTQWRLEYHSYKHDMKAESHKHTNPPVSFQRESTLSIYHAQLKLYSFAAKRTWQAAGVMYLSPGSATVITNQGGSANTVSLGRGELTPSWGLSYSLGRDWQLGSSFLLAGQIRAQVAFTEPATLSLQGLLTLGYLF